MTVRILCAAVILLLAATQGGAQPLADPHQHFFSPAVAQLSGTVQPVVAADLIALLDLARIRRVILSTTYQFGNPNRPPVEDEYAKVKVENDWTSRQVAQFPDRLRGFCGLNPLKDYALGELARCAKDPYLHIGLKLHFGNSDVDLKNPQHVEQLRRVFRAANDRRMAIVVHMRSSVTRKRPYGADQAQAFLNEVLPAALNVPVQIAHLTGAGRYDDPAVDEALAVFVDAIAKKERRMARVHFDASGIVSATMPDDQLNLLAKRIRQLGLQRVLYGSDGAGGGNLAPREAWAAFRRVPLSDSENSRLSKRISRLI